MQEHLTTNMVENNHREHIRRFEGMKVALLIKHSYIGALWRRWFLYQILKSLEYDLFIGSFLINRSMHTFWLVNNVCFSLKTSARWNTPSYPYPPNQNSYPLSRANEHQICLNVLARDKFFLKIENYSNPSKNVDIWFSQGKNDSIN